MSKLMLNKAGNKDAHFVVSFFCPPERLRGESAEHVSAGVRLHYSRRWLKVQEKRTYNRPLSIY